MLQKRVGDAEFSTAINEDGIAYEAKLNSGNNWQHEFVNLPVADAAGEKITYRVIEEPVAGYTVEVSHEADKWLIVNRKDEHEPPPPADNPPGDNPPSKDNPKNERPITPETKKQLALTGASDGAWQTVFATSILLMAAGTLCLRRLKRK